MENLPPKKSARISGMSYLFNGSVRIWSGKSLFCEHNKSPSICQSCGGSQICIHNNRKSRCYECKGIEYPTRGVPMKISHPDLTKELHLDKNNDIFYKGHKVSAENLMVGTNIVLWWKCINVSEKPCGHEWKSSASNRSRENNPSGCPYCNANALHIDGRNSMRNKDAYLTRIFHKQKNYPKNPDNVISGHSKKLWWKCEICDNIWNATGQQILNRVGSGCAYCENGYLHSDGRNLLFREKLLALEFHPTKNGNLSPYNLISSSGDNVWWICSSCNHEWKTKPFNRLMRKQGCPSCNRGDLHSNGNNSFAKLGKKGLMEEFHPIKNDKLTPEMLTIGNSIIKVWWLCKICQHEWITTVHSRENGHNCAPCNRGDLHSNGNNSFVKLGKREIIEEFHPTKNGKLTPEMITFKSDNKVWWLCKTCQHEWETAVGGRERGNGCAPCNRGDLHSDGINSLAQLRPDLAKEFHPVKNGKITPEMITVGYDKKVWWIGKKCGHEWPARVYSRTGSSMSGCPKCLKKNQNMVFDYVKVIFPKEEKILFDYKHPLLRFGKSNRKMELDIYIPGRNIAIEYQGEYHFKSFWRGSLQDSAENLLSVQKRDQEKRIACQEFGITLIEIKYNWDQSLKFIENALINAGVAI